MKKLNLLQILFTILLIYSCSSNDEEFEENTSITINFSHYWDTEEVTSEDFNTIQYTNENGEELSIERLRYLISNIYVENSNGTITYLNEDYLLVNAGEEENLTFSTENLLIDDTYSLIFRFGFSDEDNITGAYEDLTTESFDVPEMMGGGYHYMQFDGKYINNEDVETSFNYHVIRAIDNIGTDEVSTVDTSFLVNLGDFTIENKTVTLEVQMDISEWFKDPNLWDLNEYDQSLMGNYDAQIMMKANGSSVFSFVDDEEEDE